METMKFIELYNEVYKEFLLISPLSVLFRLSLAAVLGGLVGVERGRKNQPAGFRTYMIVCLGSALVMLTSEFLTTKFGTGDPARLGAQVISGIGFLGAGSIMITNMQIKGITTAAGLWAAASVGLAAGAGFYVGATVVVIFLLIIMTVMGKIDSYMHRYSKNMLISVEFKSKEHFSSFIKELRKLDYILSDIELKPSLVSDDRIGAVAKLILPRAIDHQEILEYISEMKGVKYIVEL